MPRKEKDSSRRANVVKLHPSKHDARDEGSRLIPLDGKAADDSISSDRMNHYLDLADAALGPKKAPKERADSRR